MAKTKRFRQEESKAHNAWMRKEEVNRQTTGAIRMLAIDFDSVLKLYCFFPVSQSICDKNIKWNEIEKK